MNNGQVIVKLKDDSRLTSKSVWGYALIADAMLCGLKIRNLAPGSSQSTFLGRFCSQVTGTHLWSLAGTACTRWVPACYLLAPPCSHPVQNGAPS